MSRDTRPPHVRAGEKLQELISKHVAEENARLDAMDLPTRDLTLHAQTVVEAARPYVQDCECVIGVGWTQELDDDGKPTGGRLPLVSVTLAAQMAKGGTYEVPLYVHPSTLDDDDQLRVAGVHLGERLAKGLRGE